MTFQEVFQYTVFHNDGNPENSQNNIIKRSEAKPDTKDVITNVNHQIMWLQAEKQENALQISFCKKFKMACIHV